MKSVIVYNFYVLSYDSKYYRHIIISDLTLFLMEPKVISICHQCRARPACTSVQYDQPLYFWLTNMKKYFILISLNYKWTVNKNNRCIIPINNFGMLSLKKTFHFGQIPRNWMLNQFVFSFSIYNNN